MQRRVGVRRPLDVQLVARRTAERVLLVRADLRVDAERAQERERAPRDGGAHRSRWSVDLAAAAQVDAPGDVEEPRQLGEPVAVGLRRDRGELVAEILRKSTPSSSRSRRL